MLNRSTTVCGATGGERRGGVRRAAAAAVADKKGVLMNSRSPIQRARWVGTPAGGKKRGTCKWKAGA